MWVLGPNHISMLNSLTYDPTESEETRKANVRKWFDRFFPLDRDGNPIDLGAVLREGDKYFDGLAWHQG